MRVKSAQQRQKTHSRQSVLRILAALLCAAGLMRIGNQISVAYAAPTPMDESVAVQRTDRILGIPLDNQTLPQLLEAFKARETQLILDEERALEREAALREATDAISAKLVQLEDAETKLASTLAMTDTAAAADLDRLAAVYENMKPRDTAALFSEMAPGFAAGFLGLMGPEAAASIMTELEPETAHLISIMLAGRNATAPTRQ